MEARRAAFSGTALANSSAEHIKNNRATSHNVTTFVQIGAMPSEATHRLHISSARSSFVYVSAKIESLMM
jgi:hypothetical protein